MEAKMVDYRPTYTTTPPSREEIRDKWNKTFGAMCQAGDTARLLEIQTPLDNVALTEARNRETKLFRELKAIEEDVDIYL